MFTSKWFTQAVSNRRTCRSHLLNHVWNKHVEAIMVWTYWSSWMAPGEITCILLQIFPHLHVKTLIGGENKWFFYVFTVIINQPIQFSVFSSTVNYKELDYIERVAHQFFSWKLKLAKIFNKQTCIFDSLEIYCTLSDSLWAC